MNKRNIWLVLTVFVAVIAGLFLGNTLAKRSQLRDNGRNISSIFSGRQTNDKIIELLSLIDEQYVDTIDTQKLTEEVMIDLISKLDPHSVYIPAEDLEVVNSELEGSFSGIGVQFNIQNDTIMIVAVISGGPSEKVGLLAGDRIVEVDDSAFVGKTINNEKVMKKLRGKEDSKLKLGIKRHGTDETLQFAITRGQIPVNSVDIAYMISTDIGFIKVSKFASTTYTEFLNAIAKLRTQGAKNISLTYAKIAVDLWIKLSTWSTNFYLPTK